MDRFNGADKLPNNFNAKLRAQGRDRARQHMHLENLRGILSREDIMERDKEVDQAIIEQGAAAVAAEEAWLNNLDYESKGEGFTFAEIVKLLTNELGDFVIEKNIAYGNSVETSKEIMRILYPTGIPVDKMDDSLMIVRVIDKLMRIATDKDALGESPWKDIFGYALLALVKEHKCE